MPDIPAKSATPKVDAFVAAQPPVLLTLGPVEAATRIRTLMLAWAEFARGLEISGNALPVSLSALLTDIAEYLDDRQDVKDGDYGVPEANEEMQLLTRVNEWIGE